MPHDISTVWLTLNKHFFFSWVSPFAIFLLKRNFFEILHYSSYLFLKTPKPYFYLFDGQMSGLDVSWRRVYLRRQLFFYWISKKEALSFLPSPVVAAALVLSSYSETTAHYYCYYLVTNWTIIFSQVGVEKLDSISHHGFGDLKKSKDLRIYVE